jgi:uncharacterized small protein (DUF1192 family)
MTREQIEQAANDYAQITDATKDRREIEIAFNAFLAGAEFRQVEIDTLTADIERYKADIADGFKREEIARKVIEDKREEVERMKNAVLEASEREQSVKRLRHYKDERIAELEAEIKRIKHEHQMASAC